MGEEQLKQINGFTTNAVTVNRRAMQKYIPMIRLNYSQITGRNLKEIQFQREAGMTEDSKDRKNKYEKFLEHFFSVSFANKRRGDFYVENFNSIVAWRNSIDDLFRVRRDFQTVYKETAGMMLEMQHAFILGDTKEAKFMLAQIRINLQELSEVLSCDVFSAAAAGGAFV